MTKIHPKQSLGEVHESVDPSLQPKGFRKIFAFFGPAYLVSVGYMDPGNWATDLAGGSKFGYSLIWVLLMSNLMALVLQNLSTRLGIVRGRDLAQANHEAYPQSVTILLYILAEIAIAATDLAEILGMAIGIHLLTGLPLLTAVSITLLDTLILLSLQKLGIRKMEAFIIGLVSIVGLSFLIEILLANPDESQIIRGFIPSLKNEEALYIAIGIIGATVMPHNLYLHSALVQTRKIAKTTQGIKQALKWNFWDSAIALNIAFLVNAAILVLAAKVFFETGRTDVAELKEAHSLLEGLLGSKLAPTLFAIALIAAGQSSTITGTLAGQIVMEGYLHLRINPIIRRLLTRLIAVIPAFCFIYYFGDHEVDKLLVFSQVVLSLQLGFAIIPLIHFVSDKSTMGAFAIKWPLKLISWGIASLLVYLNLRMVFNETTSLFQHSGNELLKWGIVGMGILFGGLLLYITFAPWLLRLKKKRTPSLHKAVELLETLQINDYHKIAIALDFSADDHKLLSHAIKQGNAQSSFLLIHIVESASARLLGTDSDDLETRADQERLQVYLNFLHQKGFKATGRLGFNNRTKEIVKIIQEENADMLIIGGHGHTGIKDWIYGETVNDVRHSLKIPVLIISL